MVTKLITKTTKCFVNYLNSLYLNLFNQLAINIEI